VETAGIADLPSSAGRMDRHRFRLDPWHRGWPSGGNRAFRRRRQSGKSL